MKKALKIFGILFLLLIISAVAAPIVFKDKFAGMIKTLINEQVNAQVDFDNVDISLISNFPKASLKTSALLSVLVISMSSYCDDKVVIKPISRVIG